MWTNTDEPNRNNISYEEALVFQGIVDTPPQYKPPIDPHTSVLNGNTDTYQSTSTMHKPEIDSQVTSAKAVQQQGIQKPVESIITSQIRTLRMEVMEEKEMPDEPVLIASEKTVPMPKRLYYKQFMTLPSPAYKSQKGLGFGFDYSVQRAV